MSTSRRSSGRTRSCFAGSGAVTEHLDLEDLLAAGEAALSRPPEVRDIGMLEAAVARTRASIYGEDAYPDLATKAAALLHSIVTGRALVDGNERLGWVAVRLFCRLNERDLRAPIDEAFDLVSDRGRIAPGRRGDRCAAPRLVVGSRQPGLIEVLTIG